VCGAKIILLRKVAEWKEASRRRSCERQEGRRERINKDTLRTAEVYVFRDPNFSFVAKRRPHLLVSTEHGKGAALEARDQGGEIGKAVLDYLYDGRMRAQSNARRCSHVL
jgi:hypothetical protein